MHTIHALQARMQEQKTEFLEFWDFNHFPLLRYRNYALIFYFKCLSDSWILMRPGPYG